MNKRKLQTALWKSTHCSMQGDDKIGGWPCGTCFFSISDELNNQDWQALLLYRGDHSRDNLDNLPEHIDASLDKIYELTLESQLL